MTETPHKTFAKDLLGTLLQPLGKVEIDLGQTGNSEKIVR
jgi:hypothetical protein